MPNTIPELEKYADIFTKKCNMFNEKFILITNCIANVCKNNATILNCNAQLIKCNTTKLVRNKK